jgi:hypothetical protein
MSWVMRSLTFGRGLHLSRKKVESWRERKF